MKTSPETSAQANRWHQVREFLLEVKNTPSSPSVPPGAPPWTLATKVLLRNCIFFLIAFAIHGAYYRGNGGDTARVILLVLLAGSGTSEGYDLDWPGRIRLLCGIASAVAIVGIVLQLGNGIESQELTLFIVASPILHVVPWALSDRIKKVRG
ncbi:MAG: hypothetical protein ACO1SV_22935 [Fimbriimonas sp.]